MSTRHCIDCAYFFLTPYSYWEPQEPGCGRENDLDAYGKSHNVDTSEFGDTVDCPLFEEIKVINNDY